MRGGYGGGGRGEGVRGAGMCVLVMVILSVVSRFSSHRQRDGENSSPQVNNAARFHSYRWRSATIMIRVIVIIGFEIKFTG